MTGCPVKTTPAECALLALALAVPIGVAAQDASLPDAALLEFLAEWDEADPDWLDAELSAESSTQMNTDVSAEVIDDVTDGTAPSARTEKDDE